MISLLLFSVLLYPRSVSHLLSPSKIWVHLRPWAHFRIVPLILFYSSMFLPPKCIILHLFVLCFIHNLQFIQISWLYLCEIYQCPSQFLCHFRFWNGASILKSNCKYGSEYQPLVNSTAYFKIQLLTVSLFSVPTVMHVINVKSMWAHIIYSKYLYSVLLSNSFYDIFANSW